MVMGIECLYAVVRLWLWTWIKSFEVYDKIIVSVLFFQRQDKDKDTKQLNLYIEKKKHQFNLILLTTIPNSD